MDFPPARADSTNSNISINSCESGSIKKTHVVRLYRRRYAILLLYGFVSFLNGFQWIQFSIVTDIVTFYYSVSVDAVNWTSNLFGLMYVLCIFPAMWIMSKKGLKVTLIIAAAGNTLAAALQCLSLQPDRFYVVILSQLVSATSQTFTVSVPPFIAGLWFGPREVALACGVGSILNQLGNAAGFVIAPVLVPDDKNRQNVKLGFTYLALGVLILSFISFVLVVFFFQDKPPNPPSIAQAKKPVENLSTAKWIQIMFQNKSFLFLVVSTGLFLSIFFTLPTLLNQLVIKRFPGKEVDAGWMGVLFIISGVFASAIFGHILDKTKKFRETAIIVLVLGFIPIILYAVFSSWKILWLHYIMFTMMGFLNGYITIAFEFSSELTYPGPEGISGTLLYTSPQLLSIPVTVVASELQQNYGELAMVLFYGSLAALGLFFLFFVKSDTRRSKQETASFVSTENSLQPCY